ncbi:DUF5666 domain-containing protein [Candidatus Parcubacteria bacterium]|nr:DUF5666 domain-containing protein [Candidatus Parcubacteria bacterium]
MPTISKATAIPLAALLFLGGGAIAGYTSLAGAQTATPTAVVDSKAAMLGRAPHVGGTITAISGSTLTVTAKTKTGDTTYTINAANATVTKDGAASTLAGLAVGDKVMALGTVNGSSVAATSIMSGKGFGPGKPGMRGGPGMGHGVMGKVTAVNGSTITVAGPDGKSYTVNAGSATIHRMVTGSLSDVVVGDTIGVQGTVSGNTVTAKEIMDDLPLPPARQ